MKKQSFFKTALGLAIVGGLVFTTSSCKKEGCTDEAYEEYDSEAEEDDGSCETLKVVLGTVEKTGKITANETWTSNNIYVLRGRVVVDAGATLTIEPGTIIKGAEGQEANASALIVARGGKINAVGTADQPIIFTSILDNIAQGQKVGSNLTRTDNQKWGGVAILGRAPISAENGDTEANLEGILPSEGFGGYGGTDAADNSGTLAYISIRHGGISIGEGNELNALTLGGVGTGTSISNVEIYATLDDGIECFGGTVNISNALVYFQGDDGIDLDMNYSGLIENFAVIHGDGIGTDEGLEIDGPEGSTYVDGLFTLRNGICMSVGTADGSAGDFKSKAQGKVENVTFDYSSKGGSAVKFRASLNADCTNRSDAASYVLASSPRLTFMNTKGMSTTVSVYYNQPDAGAPQCADPNPVIATLQADVQALIAMTGSGHTFDYKASFGSWTAAGLRSEL